MFNNFLRGTGFNPLFIGSYFPTGTAYVIAMLKKTNPFQSPIHRVLFSYKDEHLRRGVRHKGVSIPYSSGLIFLRCLMVSSIKCFLWFQSPIHRVLFSYVIRNGQLPQAIFLFQSPIHRVLFSYSF